MPSKNDKLSVNALFWLMLGAVNLFSVLFTKFTFIKISTEIDWTAPFAFVMCAVAFYFFYDLLITKRPQNIINPQGGKLAITEEIASVFANLGGLILFQFITNIALTRNLDQYPLLIAAGGAYLLAYLII